MAGFAIGDVVDGKYELRRVLGEGGMGIVYEARHVRLRQRVAVKMVKPEVTRSKEFVGRFEREARAAAQMGGPHVAKVIDVATLADGTSFIIMEFLVGRDLAQELYERGLLSITDAVDFVHQAACAIEDAHTAGIVHRDLKPGNLYLCDLPGTTRKLVKLLDFGISKLVEEEKDVTVTETFTTFGTATYMSPEQMRSAKSADARSDIWSLGIILFHLLVGRPPFTGSGTAVASAVAADPVPKPRAQRADIPEELEAIVLKALEKNPSRRYQTARELAEALAPLAPERSIGKVLASIPPSSMRGTPATSFALTPLTGPRALGLPFQPEEPTRDDPVTPRRRLRLAAIAAGLVAAVATAGVVTVAMGAFRSRGPSAPDGRPVAADTVVAAAASPASSVETPSTTEDLPVTAVESLPRAPSSVAGVGSRGPAATTTAASTTASPATSSARPPPPPPPAAPTASRTPLHI